MIMLSYFLIENDVIIMAAPVIRGRLQSRRSKLNTISSREAAVTVFKTQHHLPPVRKKFCMWLPTTQ